MEDFVFFWMTGEENEFLSNWYPCSFEIDGQLYENTEQYFMAKKAQVFHDNEIYEQILKTSDPKECKALGKKVSGFDSDIWDSCRFDIMTEGNLAKFRQNDDLRGKLFATGDKTLVEASPFDKIWGIGKSREEAGRIDPKQWPGQNLQGKCLMRVRNILSEEEFLRNYDDSKYPKPSMTADIAIFRMKENVEIDAKAASEGKKNRLQILLIKRGNHPCRGMYALPGGFAEPGETIDETARRELLEETGVDCQFLKQMRVFSEPGRDPRGWTITCAYLALLTEQDIKVKAADDAADAKWFDVETEIKEKEVCSGKSGGAFRTPQERVIITLRCGEEYIRSEVEVFPSAMPEIKPEYKLISSENIAFDHGLIIAYAVKSFEASGDKTAVEEVKAMM